jgi:hypothetical protein
LTAARQRRLAGLAMGPRLTHFVGRVKDDVKSTCMIRQHRPQVPARQPRWRFGFVLQDRVCRFSAKIHEKSKLAPLIKY